MAMSRELQSLLRQIRNVKSPIQRMKLTALAWRTVQRLTPTERNEIARQLGVKGFAGVLEKLGKKGGDGIAPAEMLRVLDKAEELDPSRVDELVEGLRDPEQRKGLLRKGLAFLQDTLQAEPGTEPPADDTAPAPEKTTARAFAPPEMPLPEPVPTPRPETPPAVETEVEPVRSPATGAVAEKNAPEREPVTEPVDEVSGPPLGTAPTTTTHPIVSAAPEPPPPSPPEPSEPAGALPWLAAGTATAAATAATLAPDAIETPAAEARPEVPVDSTLRDAMRSASSLVARMRVLRERHDRLGCLDVDGLRAVLAELPEGWSRRRALAGWLRSGIPSALDDALTLIEDLPRLADRGWCAKALIDALSAGDRESEDDALRTIAERFPYPSVRRRVERELGERIFTGGPAPAVRHRGGSSSGFSAM